MAKKNASTKDEKLSEIKRLLAEIEQEAKEVVAEEKIPKPLYDAFIKSIKALPNAAEIKIDSMDLLVKVQIVEQYMKDFSFEIISWKKVSGKMTKLEKLLTNNRDGYIDDCIYDELWETKFCKDLEEKLAAIIEQGKIYEEEYSDFDIEDAFIEAGY